MTKFEDLKIIKKGYATGDIWCLIDDPDAKKIRDLADKIIRKYKAK